MYLGTVSPIAERHIVLKGHDFTLVPIDGSWSMGWGFSCVEIVVMRMLALQAAENPQELFQKAALCQGTTLVVPQMLQNQCGL